MIRAADEKAVERALAKLEESKTKFNSTLQNAKDALASRFDALIQMVEKAKGLPADARLDLTTGLQAARQSFLSQGTFAKIPAMQPAYIQFVVATRASYHQLMADYDKTMRLLPGGDSRLKMMEAEVVEYRSIIDKHDTLKPGTKFVGYRCDAKWGPVIKNVSIANISFLKQVRNGTVNVSFKLSITKREGNNLEGTVSQNDGAFKAVVVGSYDGVNVQFRTTRMLKGKPRDFAYAGQIVGTIGQLELRGIKASGVATSGIVTLELE